MQAVVPAPDGGSPRGNTAEGENALFSLTTGTTNTAVGFQALFNNTIGNYNGDFALFNNATGNGNTANGHQALASNTTGIGNTANGTQALLHNQIGNGNIADGYQALINNTGSFNIAIGYTAGVNLTTGRDNIDIGATGAAGESNTIRIGNSKQTATFIRGIRGVNTRMADAIPVLIDSAGQLGTMSSSRRYKGDIETMNEASEAILSLKPVTFTIRATRPGRSNLV